MNTRESDFWNERAGPRIAPEHFGEIVATAADLAIVVGESGRVISITTNPLNSAIGSVDHWEGRPIRDFLAPDSVDKVSRQIAATLRQEERRPETIEVNHIDGAAWEFPVRYTMHLTGRDGRVLMLGRDMRPLAELQQRLVRAQIALEKDYEQQRIYETRYRVLLDAMREAVVLVDVASGRILDASDAAASLLGTDRGALTGAAFTQEFAGKRRSEFIDSLCRAAADDGGSVTAPLRDGGPEVTLRPVLFRNAGDRTLLCRLETQADRPGAGDPALAALFDGAREAIVLTDAEDRILRANDSFLTMMEVDSLTELRGRSFGDLLSRGRVDLKVLQDGGQTGPLSTRLITRFGSHLAVEITCAGPVGAGQGYVLREADRFAQLDSDATPEDDLTGGSDAGRVRALVGSAPLRDIVASMTDVIEKQCIEAAVELTSNNRVAAAEMLGLSRQSLYVKLRKYGLLQRDES
ncbi:transcriptional regulator PpsR [Jannaschia formosa]|uniref:transcriptional regulator PpsR n=1 Tax=Jannaschia formosa TaxID=2259592 RepID=UPI000E1C182F|nr:transcriptional regulator PpsR [Jannaschia formosa]TFL19319.1 transcriptional regulator PpsR [Jannaschia formosa]